MMGRQCSEAWHPLLIIKVQYEITTFPMFLIKNAEPASSSQIFRPKTSHLRPLSHQRPSSIGHHSPNPPRVAQKSPVPRELIETAPQGEYYAQCKPLPTNQYNHPPKSHKLIHSISAYGNDSLQSLRNTLQEMLQKFVLKFNDQLARQNQLIKKLQRRIEYQNQQIQTKNHIIQNLLGKLQRGREWEGRRVSVEAKKIEDLEMKMQVLVGQMEEERIEMHHRLEDISKRVICLIGGRLNTLKTALANFIHQSSKKIDKLGMDVTAIRSKQPKTIIHLQQSLQSLQNHVKLLQQKQASKENCCQINSSKDTAAHNSFVSTNNRDNLFLSDYFFHPNQLETPIFKAMEELAKQRTDQLPIRVFVDEGGRLKYAESRTLLFDRKGNLMTPEKEQLAGLEQRGWVKVCNP